MSEYKDFLPKFNEVVEKCENMASITRSTHLQLKAVDQLSELVKRIQEEKELSISSGDEENSNAYLSLECAAQSLVSHIKMWLLLKQENPDEAWDELINAQDQAISALKAHSVSSHLERYSQLLHTIEKLVFPPQVFTSTGLTVKEEQCSICGESYDECDHLTGRAYMGKFCCIIVKDMQLNEVSIVNEPADKRCRITHFDDEEGRRNRMTWAIDPASEET